MEQGAKGIRERALHRKQTESPRDKEIRDRNAKSRISSMTPLWRDRHNRRHGKGSEFDHTLKTRINIEREYSKDS